MILRAGLGLASGLMLSACAAGVEGPPRFLGTGVAPGEFALSLSSVNDLRFDGVIRQKFDFSCGSAALATLLLHHYGFDVREEAAFRGMWASGDREQIRRVGFSLLDMKRWLASRGLSADGYRVDLDTVAKTGVPGIALISIGNYRHFVVVKGIRGGEVLVGDPSAGLTTMRRSDFLNAWNGVYFALSDEQDSARTRFNRDSQWAGYVRAPVGRGLADPVSQQALMLTAPFYGDIS